MTGNKLFKTVLGALILPFCVQAQQNLTQYVNPFIGSADHGHVFVGANVPLGAVQLGPTQIPQMWDKFNGWDWCSGYNYKSQEILGFTHTHLSGTGIGDLNDLMIVPANGKLQLTPAEFNKMNTGYGSAFKKENEIARPGFYSAYLDDYQVQANLTATERVGYHQYRYEKTDNAHILVDLGYHINWDKPTDTYIKQVNDSTFVGYRFSTGWASDQKLYFAIKTSQPIQKVRFFDGKEEKLGQTTFKGQAIKAALFFDAAKNKTMELKVGISPVSSTNALNNISAEIPGWNFEKVKSDADQRWNNTLNKIQFEADKDTKTIFYTALYHTYFAPTIFNDANGDYLGTDKQVYEKQDFVNHTVFSLWDTYRGLHPLMTILEDRKINQDFIKTMLAIYQQQGKLPMWHLQGNETNTMVGLPAIPVIADAFLKGIIDEKDYPLVWEAVKTTAMGNDHGLKFARDLTYIPIDSMPNESVAWALEYAIADFGAYKIAEKLGKTEDAAYFKKRYKLYEQYFDKEVGHFVGRKANGDFRRPFDPLMAKHRENDYCEGNAWQYTWLVPQDVTGLINLFGGEQQFLKKLDYFTTMSSDLGGEASPDISGLIGQYAQGNEPNHHIPYLYAYAGQPWKGAALARKAMTDFYTNTPAGLCGNDDVGQMSAWYVFSAMGFYPLNAMSGVYVFGSPMMEHANINLPNGKTLAITVKNQGKANQYIKTIKLNGKPYSKTFITHEQLLQGGQMEIEMSAKPNKNFGKNKADWPSSVDNN
ncbi:glycoside hydrolase family 92 protein [Sphingobacterium sp. N143]|uniref:GH92 family glycosyl hydrolase n=1 Tax=Sphingobacterium sp. N143 TaxID=2746727 RepID=UPI0025782DE0|nr:GH92 family glycosyl hydrolase [Sphingobacterium sp. N143]MDM1294997.1 glycoside hydrolase family 92 protein [Sphingobacterium sp. N143]